MKVTNESDNDHARVKLEIDESGKFEVLSCSLIIFW